MVGVDEIVQSLASDPLSEIGRHSKNKEGTISSISFYIEWFNRLSAFAAIEVLKQTKKRFAFERKRENKKYYAGIELLSLSL